jgi:asparagine synthetase B (glutamine-hydrolysing)
MATLDDSVRRRVTSISHRGPSEQSAVAILFSGGLDCSIVAALCHRHVPIDQSIDLLNVAFENKHVQATADGSYQVPDRVTAAQSISELRQA